MVMCGTGSSVSKDMGCSWRVIQRPPLKTEVLQEGVKLGAVAWTGDWLLNIVVKYSSRAGGSIHGNTGLWHSTYRSPIV